MPRYIRVLPYGGYANQAFQHMLALVVKNQVPDAEIVGSYMPYWGVDLRREKRLVVGFSMDIRSHVFPIEHVVQALRKVGDGELVLRCVAMRMNYFEPYRGLFRDQFIAKGVDAPGYGSEHLVVSIRLGEILEGKFPNYGPLPIDWYRQLVRETGLKPVFYGQLGEDIYSQALRHEFPEAEFVPSRGAMADFQTLRNSKNIVLSVSTFSWLAAWLSETAEKIYMPLYLLFNPTGRADIDLIPVSDSRYVFDQFDASQWGSSEEELRGLIESPCSPQRVTATDVISSHPTVGTDGCSISRPHVLMASEN